MAITVTSVDDFTLYSRTKDGSVKRVPVSGTYSGAITGIQLQVRAYLTTDVIQEYRAVENLILDGSNWSGYLSVPDGNGYSLIGQTLINGVVDATSSQTTTAFGVGIVGIHIGQSNASKMFQPYTAVVPNANTSIWYRIGGWQIPVGDGAINFLDRIETATNTAVGFVDLSRPGTGLVDDVGSGEWLSEDGEVWQTFLEEFALAGGDCEFVIWHGGEADAFGETTTKGQFMAGLDTLYARIQALTGRDTSQLKFGVAQMATLTFYGNDTVVNSVRSADEDWGTQTTGGFFAAACIDLVLDDGVHYDPPDSYVTLGDRYANAYLYQLELADAGSVGPRILSASVDETTVTIAVRHDGGSGLTTTDGGTTGVGVTGFTFYDDDGVVAIDSTAYTGGDIVIELDRPVVGPLFLEYCAGQGPDISNPVRDNYFLFGGTVGLPLLPEVQFSVYDGSGRRQEASMATGTLLSA